MEIEFIKAITTFKKNGLIDWEKLKDKSAPLNSNSKMIWGPSHYNNGTRLRLWYSKLHMLCDVCWVPH